MAGICTVQLMKKLRDDVFCC